MKIKKIFGEYFLIIVICGILLPLGFAYLTHSQGQFKKNSHNNSTITKGFWTYSITITNPGTRSEGSLGKLFYKNKPLPLPENLSDFYETPLGMFSYIGTDGNPWDDKGWVLNMTCPDIMYHFPS